MRSYRNFIVGAVAFSLLPATGAALGAVHADMFEAEAAPARPMVETPVLPPAPPAPPAASAPEPIVAPEPAPRADPAPSPAPSRPASSGAADAQLTCLARVILYEAGNQSRAGQLAVAQVVMNRVRSPRFPNTICGVINQRGQFSNIRAYRAPGRTRWRRALAIARDARAGDSAPVVGRALYFHAAHVRPGFARSRVRVARLGDHDFYR